MNLDYTIQMWDHQNGLVHGVGAAATAKGIQKWLQIDKELYIQKESSFCKHRIIGLAANFCIKDGNKTGMVCKVGWKMCRKLIAGSTEFSN